MQFRRLSSQGVGLPPCPESPAYGQATRRTASAESGLALAPRRGPAGGLALVPPCRLTGVGSPGYRAADHAVRGLPTKPRPALRWPDTSGGMPRDRGSGRTGGLIVPSDPSRLCHRQPLNFGLRPVQLDCSGIRMLGRLAETSLSEASRNSLRKADSVTPRVGIFT